MSDITISVESKLVLVIKSYSCLVKLLLIFSGVPVGNSQLPDIIKPSIAIEGE